MDDFERNKDYSWFQKAIEYNPDVETIDELFDVYTDYCSPISHSIELDMKIKAKDARIIQLEEALRVAKHRFRLLDWRVSNADIRRYCGESLKQIDEILRSDDE